MDTCIIIVKQEKKRQFQNSTPFSLSSNLAP